MGSLRIGVWFDANHTSYGGPAIVLLGTILGLFQDAEATDRPIVLLLNEPGDVNWSLDMSSDYLAMLSKVPDVFIGPCVFTPADVDADRATHTIWNHGRNYLFPSYWLHWWVNHALPFLSEPEHRRSIVWAAGVDTDFYSPLPQPCIKYDYFIYFKSQDYNQLSDTMTYLFQNHFGLRGPTLTYYNYDPEMLRDAARNSRFCIMIDNPETQGLAALEILACGTPMFVLDCNVISGKSFSMKGCSSVTCWDERCGIKSSLDAIADDFPVFLKNLANYKPREFALEYSFCAAAHNLRALLTSPASNSLVPWKHH
jgi:hypothetical protein